MRLFIAEKPSLARAIADVLPKPHRKGDGFIECGNGQVVTWCIGHLLEQAQPDVYDSRYARWNLQDLPIVPEKWQLQPRASVTKQLNVIKRFLHDASEIIHAGDPDREGQLLVDEVLDYLQLAAEKRHQVQRCLINDLNPQAVERAISRLRSNSEFIPLCVSALARARADWLYGINMTRAYTILGRNAGLSEGAGENLFEVKDGILFTPPFTSSALPGITRDAIIKLAKEIGIEVREQVLSRESLYLADEVFMSGTAAEITPVRSVDGIQVGEGRCGPVTKRIQQAFFGLFTGETEDKWGWLDQVNQ